MWICSCFAAQMCVYIAVMTHACRNILHSMIFSSLCLSGMHLGLWPCFCARFMVSILVTDDRIKNDATYCISVRMDCTFPKCDPLLLEVSSWVPLLSSRPHFRDMHGSRRCTLSLTSFQSTATATDCDYRQYDVCTRQSVIYQP